MSRPRDWSPLRPSDPVGGNAGEIARLARRYAGTAEAITTAATALREIHGSTTAWGSDAGRAFRERTAEVAGTIEQALARYEGTAAALDGYARRLEDVQARADVVLARAKEAAEARDAAWRARERAAAQPEPDPVAERRANDDSAAATGVIRAAEEDLAPLEAEWRAAGETAADAIDDVLGADDLADGFWDDVLDVVAVVTRCAGLVSGALGLVAFFLGAIPGLQPFAAPFAALAVLAGAVSLMGNTVLLVSGRAGLDAVLWDLAGVLTFGAGRAFALAGRAVATGTRGLARPSLITHLRGSGMTRLEATRASRVAASPGRAAALTSRARDPRGWLPTRGEWAEAYRRSGLWRDPVAGPPPVLPPAATAAPQVQAGLSRAARAEGASLFANAAGTVPAANAFAGPGPAPVRVGR
ncbi:hypothetical protein E9529_05350 [Blastococcus sp. KM273128]|uniref:hypothetical protein n=1 Tax=Blastococcus sp. KM273128 TaxID=2570314 RepID=UPI001F3A5A0F|nr:hypothetical protein [Blastococcus sp. KM273128]MCF6743709.1 hypothetical protein [Blastococcus sp. KM273128]